MYNTAHSYVYPLFFKPDLGEVLSQLPDDVFKEPTIFVYVGLDFPGYVVLPMGDSSHDREYEREYHRGITIVWVPE